jgi:hypothetical protein
MGHADPGNEVLGSILKLEQRAMKLSLLVASYSINPISNANSASSILNLTVYVSLQFLSQLLPRNHYQQGNQDGQNHELDKGCPRWGFPSARRPRLRRRATKQPQIIAKGQLERKLRPRDARRLEFNRGLTRQLD